MTSMEDQKQMDQWERLYSRVCNVLKNFGKEDPFGKEDYWVHDDNWGSLQVKVYINNLALLEPGVIQLLQKTLKDLHGWELVIAIDVPGAGESWPNMGLKIRQHEIIDGLQRQYFPEQFRDYHYEGSRPGTESD
ncbi:MAG: hypothetical protein AB7K64_06725 [Variibacter sp.]